MTGVMLWVLIFITLTFLMFIPALADKELLQRIIFWVMLVPMVFLSAKWYFRVDPPEFKKGIFLGVIVLPVLIVLDLITIPLYSGSYSGFFSDWMLYVGLAENFVLFALAGMEFDKTFTKRDDGQIKQ